MLYIAFFIFLLVSLYLILREEKLNEKNKRSSIENSENKFLSLHKHTKSSFSVTTYNILCQKFMKRRNRKDLNLDNRMKIVLDELRSVNSDIICLQETNLNTFRKYILPNFLDYTFEFGENYGSPFLNVIGVRSSRFRILFRKNFELWNIDVEGNRGIFYILVQDKLTLENIAIYNVHFQWRPEYEIEKCYFLNSIAEHILQENFKHFIIAGDFNSIPDSLVMRLIYFQDFMREINLLRTERSYQNFIEMFSLQKEIEKINHFADKERQHDLTFILKFLKRIFYSETHSKFFVRVFSNFSKFYEKYKVKSSYGMYKSLLRSTQQEENIDNFMSFKQLHPNYTNYTENFKNTIDYILHPSSLVLAKLIILPEKPQLSLEHFLPSSKFPSDHIKLFAQFCYK